MPRTRALTDWQAHVTPHPFPVEAGHLLMFARSLGDDRSIYYPTDPDHRDVVAPPTFTQAAAQFDPHYPGRPQAGRSWIGSIESDDIVEPELGANTLHAEQRFEYHQPIRPGDQLTVTTRHGERWSKTSKTSGRLDFSERILEYRNGSGELVVTATEVAVTVTADGEDEG